MSTAIEAFQNGRLLVVMMRKEMKITWTSRGHLAHGTLDETFQRDSAHS